MNAARFANPRKADYLLLELALPGRPKANAGVLLFDPASQQLGVRLREDWKDLADPQDAEVLSLLESDLSAKTAEWGALRVLYLLEDSLSNALRLSEREAVIIGEFGKALDRLFETHVLGTRRSNEVLPFASHLPVYTLRAAAGKFGGDMEVEPEGWVPAPAGLRIKPDLFVAHVTGHSMEPRIPDGSLCVFRANPAGSRQGKLVLVERFGMSESGGQFTIKRYRSRKAITSEGWRHESITLEPLNPEFEAWDLSGDEFRVVAEFVRVLTVDEL